jgi:hypothetical protein
MEFCPKVIVESLFLRTRIVTDPLTSSVVPLNFTNSIQPYQLVSQKANLEKSVKL